MRYVDPNIQRGKRNLSRPIKKAESDKEIVIAKSGKRRVFGAAAGQIVFHKGWDSPMTAKDLKDFLG